MTTQETRECSFCTLPPVIDVSKFYAASLSVLKSRAFPREREEEIWPEALHDSKLDLFERPPLSPRAVINETRGRGKIAFRAIHGSLFRIRRGDNERDDVKVSFVLAQPFKSPTVIVESPRRSNARARRAFVSYTQSHGQFHDIILHYYGITRTLIS